MLTKKIIPLFLILVLLIAALGACAPAPQSTPAPEAPAAPVETAAAVPEEAAENPPADASAGADTPEDIAILYTNDVHTYIDGRSAMM